MGSGEKEFYSTIYALSSFAGEFTELSESDFAAANGAAYVPPEIEGEFRRVNVARTIQLLKNSTLSYKTTHTNTSTKIRVPCGLIASNDALDGRPYIIWNSGTSNLSVENYAGTVLTTLKPTQRCIVFHTENDNWLVLFNAKDTQFDNSTNGFIANDVQAAIEELKNTASITASPGFTWGRSGTIPAGTWLLNDTVTSNVSGREVFLNNAVITKIYVSNKNPDIIKIGVYYHSGDGVSITSLGTVTTAAQRSNDFTVSWAVPKGTQLAIKVELDTPNSAKDTVVGILMTGTIT